MPIDRCEKLSYREFEGEYLRRLRPVIITDAIADWLALGKWTPEFFRDRYGTISICVEGRRMALAELIERMLASTPSRPAPYLRNQLLSEWPRELREDVAPLPIYTQPNWLESPLLVRRRSLSALEIFFGGLGTRFPVLHYDGLHTHAFVMEVYGRKEFWCYSPDQAELMYPHDPPKQNRSTVNDVERPDLDRFPLFAKAVCDRLVLEPGEALFIPAGWWHTTRLLGSAISVSIGCANETNWSDFARDYGRGLEIKHGRLIGQSATLYLDLVGRALRTLRDRCGIGAPAVGE